MTDDSGLILCGFLFSFDSGACQQTAEGAFAAGATLLAGNVSVAIDHNVNGIRVGLIHGGEIRVLSEDDSAGAGMLLEIFLDCLLGFSNVNGEHDQALVTEFFVDGSTSGSS